MYYKYIFIFMAMFSGVRAFHVSNMKKSIHSINHMVMRLKKTSANNYDDSCQPKKSRVKSCVPNYKPRSDNQKKYVSHLNNYAVPIVFGIGPAGCGKTLFACITAIEGLKRGNFQKIILTRPIVPVEEEELGFLPGSLVKKMDPWTRPLMDIFLEYYPQHEIEFMLGSGVIEISPLAYMRGRTFKRSFIIADEMQNSTPNQMLMLTTRIGDDSKMVITGDLKQSDRCENNGLLDIMTKIKSYHLKEKENLEDNLGIEMVEMNIGDIERSPIVSKILKIFKQANHKEALPIDTDHGLIAVEDVNSLVPEKKTIIDNDAALIPITDMSRYYPKP